MHPLHDYVAKQLPEKLRAKKLVVWYDPRSEFAPFVGEVCSSARTSSIVVPVTVSGIATQLAEYGGSMFELCANVEPYQSQGTFERAGEQNRNGVETVIMRLGHPVARVVPIALPRKAFFRMRTFAPRYQGLAIPV